MSDINNLLSPEEETKVIEAIEYMERLSSGEIRVHMENHCRGDLMERATAIFEKLSIHKTEQRNGVLLYFAVEDHKLAVLGDKGINAVVGENYWEEIRDEIVTSFKAGQACEGIIKAIKHVGAELQKHFPPLSKDQNELPDTISYDD